MVDPLFFLLAIKNFPYCIKKKERNFNGKSISLFFFYIGSKSNQTVEVEASSFFRRDKRRNLASATTLKYFKA